MNNRTINNKSKKNKNINSIFSQNVLEGIVIDVSLFLVHVYRVLTVYMLCYTPATYTRR